MTFSLNYSHSRSHAQTRSGVLNTPTQKGNCTGYMGPRLYTQMALVGGTTMGDCTVRMGLQLPTLMDLRTGIIMVVGIVQMGLRRSGPMALNAGGYMVVDIVQMGPRVYTQLATRSGTVMGRCIGWADPHSRTPMVIDTGIRVISYTGPMGLL